MTDEKFRAIAENLSPERPIRSEELLKGRSSELANIDRELRHFNTTPFIYGYRGVGKTSLARTAAQIVTTSDREHIYVACAPGARMLHIFREIGEEFLKLIFRHEAFQSICNKVEVEISLNPKIRTSFENKIPQALAHSDVVDVRIDEWIALYEELTRMNNWRRAEEKQLRTAIGNVKKESYGEIVANTPARYGSAEQRYRYKGFRNMLMRGHVRLQAENEGYTLGKHALI